MSNHAFELYDFINIHVHGIYVLIKIITIMRQALPLRFAGTAEWHDVNAVVLDKH